MRYRSLSPGDTGDFAEKVARSLLSQKAKRVIILSGELGSGKTTFVRGFLKAYGVRKRVVSPTFVIIRRFHVGGRLGNIYHLDCYRLRRVDRLLKDELKRIFSDRKNIVLIEWGERIARFIPKTAVRIEFLHGKYPHERIIIYERKTSSYRRK